jgi:hypothetical protein
MNGLTASIHGLKDATAERILATIANHRLQPTGGSATTWTPELSQALTQAIGEVPDTTTGTHGDLARATLLLLAEDPARRPELQALIENPPAEKFAVDPVTITLLGTAALVVLQTYVKIEYDKKLGIRVILERQPPDKSLLRQIVGLMSGLYARS